PLIRDLFAVMSKIAEIKLVAPIASQQHDLVHGIHKCGLAVRCEAHDFVLVAVVRKAQKLRECLIKDAERMWEIHPSIDGNICTLAYSPSCATKISEAVD